MQSAISISAETICFIIYYFTIHSEGLEKRFINKFGALTAKSRWVMFQRMTGFFLFGIVPIILALIQNISFAEIGITLKSKTPILLWIVGLSAICFLINFFESKKDSHLEIYPQIRTPFPWNNVLIFMSSLTLVLYTLAYEIMLRGYLLFTCERELGIVLAIVINTAIYALVHIPKGWKETIGTIPMGIILCWLTFASGNIWIAVFVHVALALSSEWFSIREHMKRVGIYV